MKLLQETSLDVYYERVLPNLNSRQFQVWRAMKNLKFAVTSRELSAIMKLHKDNVAPRMTELKRMGLIKEDCVRKCDITKNNAKAYVIDYTKIDYYDEQYTFKTD